MNQVTARHPAPSLSAPPSFFLLLAAALSLTAQIGTKSIAPVTVARKLALVIGNSAYTRLDAIPAAANDADDMTAALRRLGFGVSVRKNLAVEELITGIGEFSESLHAGDLAVIYYSGHGGSVGEENYLLPVDYDPPSEKDLVERRAYAMSKVRDAMERSGARVRVLIFDACRSSAVRAKGSEGDARPIEGRPEGTLIAFASAHKQDAMFDARERNSLYTGRLLAALKNPDSDLKGLLEGVQRQVYEDTRHEQTPYLYGFLSGPLYLAGVKPSVPKTDAAVETWALIRDSRNPVDFDEFARSYSGSALAPGARLRAAQLRREAEASIVTPSLPGGSTLRAGQVKVNPKDGQRYVWIPPGKFTMGCSAGDNECVDDEKPAHEVEITKGLWLGQTAVTVGAWKRYRAATGKPALPTEDADGRKNLNEAGGDDNLPAAGMTWDEAKSYCEWQGGRLPTEAEWEYAARAGNMSSRYGNLDAIAWYGDNSGKQRIDSADIWRKDPVVANYVKRLFDNGNGPHPVGQKQPNAWNLYDMLGNVWQWTADWYDAQYYTRRDNQNPLGPPGGTEKTLRGGSWYFIPRIVRVSNRGRGEPSVRNLYIGLRCVGN